jgi:hypothetical protein
MPYQKWEEFALKIDGMKDVKEATAYLHELGSIMLWDPNAKITTNKNVSND